MGQQVRVTYMFDCLYLSPKLKQNTTQTPFLSIKRVTNFKTHKSPPKRHDCNDFLKWFMLVKISLPMRFVVLL